MDYIMKSTGFSIPDSFLFQWAAPFGFSLVCIMLMVTIVLVARLNYSRTVRLTKLSLYPYYTIMAYLATEAIEIILIVMIFDTIRNRADWHFFYGSVIWPLVSTFSIVKFVAYTLFINSQVF